MELKGKITGNLREYKVKRDNTNDGKTAHVLFDVTMDEPVAKGLGGDLFKQFCFSDFVGKSAASYFKSKKFDGDLEIKDNHTILVDDYSAILKPKLVKVEPCKDSRQVVVTVKLLIPGNMKKLRRKLDEGCGDDFSLDFAGITQADIEDVAGAGQEEGGEEEAA